MSEIHEFVNNNENKKSKDTLTGNQEFTHVKSVITDALMGNEDAAISIEKLSELLFPGENLLEKVLNQKIILEITSHIAEFQKSSDFKVKEVGKKDGHFFIDTEFDSIATFNHVQQKLMTVAYHVSKKFNIRIVPSFFISQPVDGNSVIDKKMK